jgi:hypothetical protein
MPGFRVCLRPDRALCKKSENDHIRISSGKGRSLVIYSSMNKNADMKSGERHVKAG